MPPLGDPVHPVIFTCKKKYWLELMLIKKRFYFVRHGETDWNKETRCQGHTDIPLNETGRLQAKTLGEKIGTYPFCSIFASPLKRALETAQILHQSIPHLTLTPVHQLKERYYGQLEGGPSFRMFELEELEREDPSFFQKNNAEPSAVFQERVIEGMNICLKHSTSPLIVSHGRFFTTLRQMLNLSAVHQIHNTALFLFEPTDSGWNLKSLL